MLEADINGPSGGNLEDSDADKSVDWKNWSYKVIEKNQRPCRELDWMSFMLYSGKET